MRHLLALPTSLSLLCLSYALAHHPERRQDDENHNGMQRFVTRPDIEPARWNVEIYDRERLAPGYWFVSPYEKNGYKLPGGSWIGPHIYDNDGELIWSGSHLFNKINVMDFKVQKVGDEEMLSMLYAVEGNAYLLDHAYRVKDTIFVGETGVTFNMHDFHTVEDGSKFLYLQRNVTQASREMSMEELGFDGMCNVTFPGFEERDVETKDVLFKWDATGIIPFSDSTMDAASVESRCRGWDYLHSNAIDKFNDGHYLLSTRHSDTIYKISKDDGSIIWRLHGTIPKRSDFKMIDLEFSRQHHARLHENNDTHVVISILDNALGADAQAASASWSRAIRIVLRVDQDPMTAELVSVIDHPKHKYAFRRGSHQILPNGNSFVGWSERALQSEHAPDGEILMEAELEAAELGTYRAFKFPFVATPGYPPDIYSAAITKRHNTTTKVHVSWNGATEVTQWRLFKTDKSGKRTSHLATVPRTGFETAIDVPGFARYVYAQAVGREGSALEFGDSELFETNTDDGVSAAAEAAEQAWLDEETTDSAATGGPLTEAPDHMGDPGKKYTPIKVGTDDQSKHFIPGTTASISSHYIENPILTAVGGIAAACILFFIGLVAYRLGFFNLFKGLRRGGPRNKGPQYSQVAPDDAVEFDERGLDSLTPGRTYDRVEDEESFKIADEDDEDEDETERGELRTPSTERGSGG